MIQDIYPRVYHNEYQNIKPECGDFVLIFFENTALIRLQDGRLRYPSFEETRELSCDYHYLFSIDNFRYFLACTRIR
ncbi:MAG: NAD(+) diphosphatase, partial [Lachnospiraceae bacterium]|nr:NAD(+) diphosphatase [Lachnospiraceae bacterium]